MKHTKRRAALHGCVAFLMSLAAATEAGAATNVLHPGDLDTTLGLGGKLTTDFFTGADEIYALAPLPNGRFLAAGAITGPNAVGPGGSRNYGVVRYLADGRIDSTFGTQGLFQFDHDGSTDEVHAMKVLGDGHVLLAGPISTSAHTDFGIARLTASGQLDPTFGAVDVGARKGFNTLAIDGVNVNEDVVAMAVQSTGKIVVVGIGREQVGNFQYYRTVLARFTADGLVDTTFGGNGTGWVKLATSYTDPSADEYPTAIALTQRGDLPADDSITVVGYTFARNNAFVARVTANGAVDTTFGSPAGAARSGRTTFQSVNAGGGVYTGVSELHGARIASDGRIVIAGTAGDRGATVMRLQPNGSLDTTFASNGRITVKFSNGAQYDTAFDLALQGNGKIVAAGFATSVATGAPREDFYVVRLLPNGQVDAGFGDGQGRAIVPIAANDDEAHAIAVEPSGNLLVGGYAQSDTRPDNDFAIMRLIGDPDRIFFDDYEVRP